jgi:hypothetical protein
MMRKLKFVHDREQDGYRGLKGQLLAYATTDRNGYRHYRCDPAICPDCPRLASCSTHARRSKPSRVTSGPTDVNGPMPIA